MTYYGWCVVCHPYVTELWTSNADLVLLIFRMYSCTFLLIYCEDYLTNRILCAQALLSSYHPVCDKVSCRLTDETVIRSSLTAVASRVGLPSSLCQIILTDKCAHSLYVKRLNKRRGRCQVVSLVSLSSSFSYYSLKKNSFTTNTTTSCGLVEVFM